MLTPGQCLGQQINSLAERQPDLFAVTYKTVSWSGFSSDVAARAEPQLLSLGTPSVPSMLFHVPSLADVRLSEDQDALKPAWFLHVQPSPSFPFGHSYWLRDTLHL